MSENTSPCPLPTDRELLREIYREIQGWLRCFSLFRRICLEYVAWGRRVDPAPTGKLNFLPEDLPPTPEEENPLYEQDVQQLGDLSEHLLPPYMTDEEGPDFVSARAAWYHLQRAIHQQYRAFAADGNVAAVFDKYLYDNPECAANAEEEWGNFLWRLSHIAQIEAYENQVPRFRAAEDSLLRFQRRLQDAIDAAHCEEGAEAVDGELPEAAEHRKWQEVRAELLKIYDAGEPWTSYKKMGERLKCAVPTVHRAVTSSPQDPRLMEWVAKPPPVSEGMASFDTIGADAFTAKSESLGDDLEPADEDAALRYLIENAGEEERATIHAMKPADRRRLAEEAYKDSEHAQQIWRSRQRQRRPTAED